MLVLKTEVGSQRVELQQLPIIVPIAAWDGLSPGDKNKIKNPALKYTILVWNGTALDRITSSAALPSALNQYRVRVQQEFGIDVPKWPWNPLAL